MSIDTLLYQGPQNMVCIGIAVSVKIKYAHYFYEIQRDFKNTFDSGIFPPDLEILLEFLFFNTDFRS